MPVDRQNPETALATSTFSSFARHLSLSAGDTNLTPAQARIDVLSGLTVALALVPEAVAFASERSGRNRSRECDGSRIRNPIEIPAPDPSEKPMP